MQTTMKSPSKRKLAKKPDPRREIRRLRAKRDAIEAKLDALPTDERYSQPRHPLVAERHALVEQIEALEALGDGGPRLAVVLDDYASALVRRYMSQANPGVVPGDVVNGALSFMLGEDDDHDQEPEISKAADRRGDGQPDGMHVVSLELSPRQYEMAMRMAEFDHEPTLSSWIKADLEESVVCSADCFEESQRDTRAAWNGEAVKIRNNKEAA